MSEYKRYTEAGKNASIKYMKKSRDKLTINLPKGKKEELKAKAERKGFSLTSYILHLIENDPE